MTSVLIQFQKLPELCEFLLLPKYFNPRPQTEMFQLGVNSYTEMFCLKQSTAVFFRVLCWSDYNLQTHLTHYENLKEPSKLLNNLYYSLTGDLKLHHMTLENECVSPIILLRYVSNSEVASHAFATHALYVCNCLFSFAY